MSSQNSTRTKKVIFVVDDEEGVLFLINYWFVKNHFIPVTFHDTKEMIKVLEHVHPDLILLDVRLSNGDGRTICQYLKEECKLPVPVVLFSSDLQYSENVSQWLAAGFVEKGSDYYQMAKTLETFLLPSEAN